MSAPLKGRDAQTRTPQHGGGELTVSERVTPHHPSSRAPENPLSPVLDQALLGGSETPNATFVIELTDASLERLADLLAERLQTPRATAVLVTAAELADKLGVDPKTVYRHADELGAVRVGRRVMFDSSIEAASRYAGMRSQAVEPPAVTGRKKNRKRASESADCQLLPVGRRRSA